MGAPKSGPTRKLELEDFMKRFEINLETGCWEWTGPTNSDGYGAFGGRGRAHCMAYEMWVEPIPEGQLVCHTCDNPPCICPEHLFVGTFHDNLQDAIDKGRHSAPPTQRGEQANNVILTEEGVKEIRAARGVMTQGELAARYGIDQTTVSDVQLRRSWAHV